MNKNIKNFIIDFLSKKISIDDSTFEYLKIYFNKDDNFIYGLDKVKEMITNFILNLSDREIETSESKDESKDESKGESNESKKIVPASIIPLFISYNSDYIQISSFMICNIVLIFDEKQIYKTIYPNTIVNIYILLDKDNYDKIFKFMSDNSIVSVLLKFSNFNHEYIEHIITLQDKMDYLQNIGS